MPAAGTVVKWKSPANRGAVGPQGAVNISIPDSARQLTPALVLADNGTTSDIVVFYPTSTHVMKAVPNADLV